MHKIQIEANKTAGKINRNIYGHFSEHLGRCIYGGFYVDEDGPVPNKNGLRMDVAEALKKIKIPVLRWPGGCFADEYHWMDGIGPKQNRPSIVNTHWGGVVEDNSFGTHEFMQLCELLECEPYICGNMGSGTVKEMSQWIEYITFGGVSPMAGLRAQNGRSEPWHLKYFGVGNENWGCGGNMTPEYYAGEYRRYQTYCRNYGENKLYKIACGPNSGDYEWTETMMKNTVQTGKHLMDAISLHYYTVPGKEWNNKGAATGFSEKEWFITLKKTLHMNELIEKHSAIMDKYDPDKKVALIVDEWGTWYDVEPGTNPGFLYQQNSLRDALVAALNFHIFHDHSERVQMANIAQTVNVLQAVILTEGEKVVTTPTYHVFDMFSGHQDADALEITYDRGICEMDGESIPAISASASKKDGKVLLSLVNLSPENPASAKIELGGGAFSLLEAKILHSDKLDEHNTFDSPENIVPVAFNGVAENGGAFELTLPPASVMTMQFEEKA